MRRFLLIALVLVAVAAGLIWAGGLGLGPVLITREGEQKMVLFFGNPVHVQREPGIWWRVPLATRVLTFDSRYLYADIAPGEVPTRNQERIVVDNYVIWRVDDPRRFFESFRGDFQRARQRIGDVVAAALRAEIGRRTIPQVLTEDRVEIMDGITEDARQTLADSGIEVRDVRINRTELPEGIIENVYARMRSERERLARQYRAEGEEQARRIRAEADREARVIVARARRDAEILRGEGDARAAAIYAEAYGADPGFFGFWRSLEAYRGTLGEGTTLVLPPSSPFFRALQDPGAVPEAAPSPAAARAESAPEPSSPPPPAPVSPGPAQAGDEGVPVPSPPPEPSPQP